MAVLAIAGAGALLGAGVGASVGAIALGAQIGWLAGSFIGNLFFGPEAPTQEGPRLTDLSVQSSAEGVGIPIVFGRARIAGNVIWARPIQETRHEEEVGKGMGGGGTQVSYTYSVSFAIGLCEGSILGIRKIWADSKLIYEASSGAGAGTLIVSHERAQLIRVYIGSETQTADPIIQSFEGVANTPAYRGLAYIVFEDLELSDLANHMPNITCEVIGSGSVLGLRHLSTLGWSPGESDDTGSYPRVTNAVFRYRGDSGKDNVFDAGGVLLTQEPASEASVLVGYLGANRITASFSGVTVTFSAGGQILYQGNQSAVDAPVGIVLNPSRTKLYVFFRRAGGGVYYRVLDASLAVIRTVDPAHTTFDMGTHFWQGWKTNILIDDREQTLWHVYQNISSEARLDTYTFASDGTFALAETISRAGTAGGNFYVSALTPESADNGVLYVTARSTVSVFTNYPVLTSSAPTLAGVVSALCTRTGLVAGDLDVTALTDTVDGYVIPRPMTARAALEQLRQAYFFDGVESDGKVKFVKRGGASQATIPSDDLGTREYGSEPQEPLRITRAQELELPLEVHVGYLDLDNDYLPGSQEARRLTTQSKNQIRVDLPLALSSTKAAQVADVLMRNSWVERHRFGFSVTRKYAHLDPSDNITVPSAQGNALVRLTRTDYGAGGVLACEALADDTVLYSSSAVGNDASVNEPQTLSLPGPTNAVLLDVAMLRDADDDPGFYIAAAGYLGGWRGAALYKSVDGGATWDAALSLLTGATLGYTTGVLGNFTGGNVWDKGSTVNVKLTTPGAALASTTELSVYAGANAAAIGAHGRWEIIQFQTATLQGDGTYTLSNLLRGRRGTEWAQSTHVSGDVFVLLTSATLRRLEAASAEIGLQRHYRAVSIGTSLESAEIKSFTNAAAGLECYAPVNIGGGRNAASDILINWERRTRVGGEWRDYVDASLGESAENYEVEIWNTAFSLLKRTITGLTAKTTTYTSAQQVTDFGSNQASVGVKAYQVSPTVGRGYVGQGTLTLSFPLFVYQDKFDTDSLAQYTQHGDTGAAWSIASGELTATGGSQALLIYNDYSSANASIECDINHAYNGGLILRFQDNNNYYLCTISDDSGSSPTLNNRLWKRVAGTFTLVNTGADSTFTRGTAHTVRFTITGTLLTVHFDGVEKISVTDSSISSAGKTGMRNETAAQSSIYQEFRIL